VAPHVGAGALVVAEDFGGGLFPHVRFGGYLSGPLREQAIEGRVERCGDGCQRIRSGVHRSSLFVASVISARQTPTPIGRDGT
jgi:hypothetical protein